MSRWRQVGIAAGVCAAGLLSLAVVLPFLAPSLSYQVKDRVAESVSGNGGRKFRIALGAVKGSYYRLGNHPEQVSQGEALLQQRLKGRINANA